MPGRSLAAWRDAAVRRLRGTGGAEPAPPPVLPDVVDVEVPAAGDRSTATFRMYTRAGADQIARDLAKFGWHGFERPLPDVFAGFARAAEGLVVDVGANTGFYCLVAAAASPVTRVHAFEPYPPALRLLEENLALNPDLTERVHLYPQAVSDDTGEGTLHVPDPGHGLVETSCSLNREFKERVVDGVPVEVVTLDAHLESVGRPGVSVVKIDVESLEHRVLAGAERTLSQDRPVVLLEVLPSGRPEAIDAIRRRHDYVPVRLRPDGAVVGGSVRFDAEGWNQALVPAEKVRLAQEVLAQVPLPVTFAEAGD